MSRFPQLLAASFLLASFATAQNPDVAKELKELRERIDEIEEMQFENSERIGDRALVQAFSARSFDLGGHVTSLFTAMDGEASNAAGHLVSLVELFVKADLDDDWSLFASPGFYQFNGGLLDSPLTPTTAGDPTFTADTAAVENLFVSRIYGEWKPNDAFRVQGGIVGSPHGTTNREYFIPARTIAANPMSTRVFLANQLFPQNLRGLKASGKFTVGESDWIEYDVYYGGQTDIAGGGDDPLYGGRAGYTFGDLGLTVAANVGRGTRQGAATPTTNAAVLQSPFTASYFSTRDYQFAGLDIDWRKGAFIFKGEAYVSSEAGLADQRALSAETTYYVHPQWGLSYRYDFYDAGGDILPIPLLVDLGHATEHVVGIAYNPHPSVRLRLDLHHTSLPNTPNEVQFVNFSWSLSF